MKRPELGDEIKFLSLAIMGIQHAASDPTSVGIMEWRQAERYIRRLKAQKQMEVESGETHKGN